MTSEVQIPTKAYIDAKFAEISQMIKDLPLQIKPAHVISASNDWLPCNKFKAVYGIGQGTFDTMLKAGEIEKRALGSAKRYRMR